MSPCRATGLSCHLEEIHLVKSWRPELVAQEEGKQQHVSPSQMFRPHDVRGYSSVWIVRIRRKGDTGLQKGVLEILRGAELWRSLGALIGRHAQSEPIPSDPAVASRVLLPRLGWRTPNLGLCGPCPMPNFTSIN